MVVCVGCVCSDVVGIDVVGASDDYVVVVAGVVIGVVGCDVGGGAAVITGWCYCYYWCLSCCICYCCW